MTHDSKPHTVESSIYVHLTYGDTEKAVSKFALLPFFEWRLRRGIRRVVRKHDEGSIAAGRTADLVSRVVAEEAARPRAWQASEGAAG